MTVRILTGDCREVIADVDARRIASEWHGGGGSPLYVLTSTGAIDLRGLLAELSTIAPASMSSEWTDDLRSLALYIVLHGPRGPVDGWGRLSW